MAKEKARKLQYQTSFKERMSYGLYFVGQNIFYLFILQYLMLFYTDYRFISPAVVGAIFVIARVWDAVNDPLFGIIVDKTNMKRGKFKPWITIATVFIPIAAIVMFAMPENMDMNGKIAYAAATYIIFGMLYTVCDVPIFALATAMTNNIQERTTIIAIGRTAATIAMLIISIIIMPLILALGWLPAAVIFSIVAFIFMIPVSIFAKERYVDTSEGSAVTIKGIFQYLKGNKYLLIFYCAVILTMSTNTAMSVGNYIAKYMLGGEEMIPLVMMMTIIPMLIVSIFLPALTKRIDKFHIYVFGILLNIVFSVIGYFAGYSNLPLFLALSAVRGVSYGLSMVMMFMFAADCVEYGNFKTGNRAEGITFSIQTFASKMTGAISGGLAGFLLTAIGYNGALEMQSASTLDGMWKIYLLFPLVGMVLALPVLSQYKLRDKDVQVMAEYNQKQITREEAEAKLSRKY